MEKSLRLLMRKEKGKWFNIDEKNGFTQDENEMVGGVPDLIEMFVGTEVKNVEITLSTERVNCTYYPLKLISDKDAGGVSYMVDFGFKRKNPIIWLCKVFWYYFETAPRNLYYKIIPV